VKISRRIVLIPACALVVVVGAWYGALWHPAQKHLATLRTEQVAAANNLVTLQVQVSALKAEQKQLPKDKKALRDLNALIPADPGLDQLIKVIDNAANEAGVSLTSLGTPPPSGWGAPPSATGAATTGPQIMSINVGFQGSDRGVLQFVTDLDAAPRLFVVDSFDLNSVPGASATPRTTPVAGATSTPVTSVPAAQGTSGGAGTGTANTYSMSITAFYVSGASNDPVFPGSA
jgi:Tfp pilus assembly protein PilO